MPISRSLRFPVHMLENCSGALKLLFFKSANLSSLFLGVILELLGLVFLLNDFNHSLFNLHILLEFKVLEVTSMLD